MRWLRISGAHDVPSWVRWVLWAALSGGWLASLAAQEDPFGGAAGPAAGKAEGPARPAAAGKTAPGARSAEEPPPLPLALRLLQESPPSRPDDLVRAAEVALQHERPDLARGYLQKLLAGMASDDELAPLAVQRADVLLKFGAAPDLQPEGPQVVDKIFAAARRQAQDPRRIAEAIAQLSAASATARSRAMLRLADAGPEAIGALVAVLADASRTEEHAALRAALVTLARDNPWSLIAVLESADEPLQMQVLTVLGRIGTRAAVPWIIDQAVLPSVPPPRRELARLVLMRMGVTRPELDLARRLIASQIETLLAGQLPEGFPAGDPVLVWQWTTEGKLSWERQPRDRAAQTLAQRLARTLLGLATDPPSRQQALLWQLEVAQRQHGLDRPLDPATLAAAGWKGEHDVRAALPQLLRTAVQQGRTGAALASLALLAETGDPSWLVPGPGPSADTPLVEALRSADRRVRLAACLTALQLAPGGSFPGAGLIGSNLGWLAAARGVGRLLVGHPRADEGQRLVSSLMSLGYEAEVVPGGRMLVERALHDPDCEGVLLADSLTRPPVEEVVQWLRRDYRTARLPVLVLAWSERQSRLAETLAEDPATAVVQYPYSAEALAALPGELARRAGHAAVGRAVRREQAARALQALAMLSQRPDAWQAYGSGQCEDVLIEVLHHNPPQAALAAQVLGELGTPAAQRALWDLVLASEQPLELRQAAAAALGRAIQRRGLGLTSSQAAHYRQQLAATADGPATDAATARLCGELMSLLPRP